MAADKRKDKPDLSGIVDDAWDSAIDEWEQKLEMPEDPAPKPKPAAPQAAAPTPPAPQRDALVDLLGGEMELPDEGGEALGSLLGSGAVEEPTPVRGQRPTPVYPQPAVQEEPTPIKRGPIERGPAEQAGAAKSQRQWDDDATPISLDTEGRPRAGKPVSAAFPPPKAEPVKAAPVQPAHKPKPAVAKPEPVAAKPAPKHAIAKPTPVKDAPPVPADFDLDSLLDGLGTEPGVEEPPPRTPEPVLARPAPEPEPEPAFEPAPPPPAADLFDLVGDVDEEIPEPTVEEQAVAGDVLPAAEAIKPPAGPMLLPAELEEEPEAEPPLELAPVPEGLLRVELVALDAPAKASSVACSRAYWQSLADLMQTESRATDSSTRAAAMELMAARALEELGEVEEAITHYREALGHRADYVPAMRELRRVYTARRELDQAAEMVGQLAERVGPEERRALMMTRAELLWSRAGDDAGAAGAIDPAIGPGDPDHVRALLLKADLACAGRDDDELEEVLGQLAAALTDKALIASAEVELGRLRESRGQAEEARAAYRRALAADPEACAAQEGLLRLAASQQDAAGLAAALGATAGLTGTWGARRRRRRAKLLQHYKLGGNPVEELAEAQKLAPEDALVLEDLAAARAAAGDAAGAVETLQTLARCVPGSDEQAVLLGEAADLSRHALQAPQRALELYGEALSMASLPALAARRAETLLASSDPQHRLEALRAAAASLRGAERAALHLAAASILDEELHNTEEAAEELLACLEHEPACRIALARLEGVYRQSGQLDRLAAVLDTAAEAADDPGEVGELRERSAHLHEGPLGKPDVAMRRYRELAELGADRPFVRLGLLRLLASLDHHDDLSEELSMEATSATSPRRAARAWTRCGDALWAAGRQEEAKASYRMAVGKLPEHAPATWRLVLWEAGHRNWREVADAWGALTEVLPAGQAERRALQLRLATVHEQELADPGEAARWYRAALAETESPGARDGLRRCLRRTQSFDQLLEEIQKDIEAVEPAQRFALLMLAGDLARRSGGDWSDAEARYRRALEDSGRHPIARVALEHLLGEHQAWQQLADLMMADLNEAAEVDARIRAYHAMAELDLRRGDEESARLSFESIVELNPSHLPALRFLQRRLLNAGDRRELFGALRREAEAASQPLDGAALWLELARCLSSAPPAATEDAENASVLAQAARELDAHLAYQRALELDPRCILALRCLLDAAWAKGNREDQARFYELLARVVERSADAAIYLTRAGELAPDDVVRVRLLRESLERVPEFLGAIYNLRQAALRASDWASAALAAEGEGRASRVNEHAAAAYLLAGEIARRHLNEPERAARSFRAVLAADPANRIAFEALREAAQQSGAWEDLAELLAARTKVERSRVQLVELHRSLAAVCKDHLRDRARAKQELRDLLALRPEDPDALSTLADLHTEDEEWPEAVETLIRRARLEKTHAGLGQIFLRLGRIYQEKLPDLKRALASLNRVVSLDPEQLEALKRLSDLHLEHGDYKRALAVTTQLFEKETEPAAKVEHMLRIAKIHEDGLKDNHQAAIAFRHAQELAPYDLNSIGELCGFFARQGDQRSLMVHLDRSVAAMRARLHQDPFDSFGYHALFRIFGWRKAPDACLCATQVVEALGELAPEERDFLRAQLGAVGAPGKALGDPEHDEWLFHRSIPGGFRQVFRMLAETFVRTFPGNLKTHGVGRGDKLGGEVPARRLAESMARDLGVGTFDLYRVQSNPGILLVENTDPPAILLGASLLEQATEEELRFMLGRCLWIIGKAMILPTRFRPEDLEVVVAAVVRQYSADFQPPGTAEKELAETTRQIAKAIPKKIRQELMPFALECAGSDVSLRDLGAAVGHSANRAGLLAARSVAAAMKVLRKSSGRQGGPEALRGDPEAEELLAFAVSDAYFELRRGMGIAIGR